MGDTTYRGDGRLDTRLIMPRPVPVFEGNTVRMRPIDVDLDAEPYFKYSQDAELHRWTGNVVPASVEEARAELRRLADRVDLSTWLILDRTSDELAGRFFLCLEERDGRRIVGEGNRIARRFWRKGHNREARLFMFQYAFETLNADTYETEVWAANTNSVKSIEAHGFRFVWQEERLNSKCGQILPVLHYAMTADQWHSDGR